MGGTGETLQQAGERALGAVDALFERLEPGQRAAVVTHGGFLQPVLGRHLRGRGRRVHAFSENTGITRVVHQFGRPRLATFNDTGHLGARPRSVETHLDAGNRVLALVRHGRTRANVEQRWQGQGDWDLDETGQTQANALRDWYGTHPTVYASPLRRAMSTAGRLATTDVIPTPGLMELNMGAWEGLTTAEIVARWPEAMETIYRHGVDLRRGETGETWGELTSRIANTLAALELVDHGPTVVVGHGGAIRAYVSSLTRSDDSHSESLFTPPNTSVTHIALTESGPEILDFAVSAHLETLK
jgi:broad specificity phosphatase PhoE